MFTIIEGAVIVTRSKGIYRQGKLYARNLRVYAQWGNGYITIAKGVGDRLVTSLPDVVVDEILNLDKYKFTKVGALVLEGFIEEYKTAAQINASTPTNPKGIIHAK